MKKTICILLCLSLLLVTMNFSVFLTVAEQSENKDDSNAIINLTSDEFTLFGIANCTIDGNTVYSVSNLYPQFRINLNNTYYIREISINVTVSGRSYICTNSAAISAADSKYMGTVNAGQTTDLFLESEKYTQVEEIGCNGYWSGSSDNMPTNKEASIVINSITIIGSQLTETVVLEEGDFTLSNNNNCTISGNVMTSWAKQYPTFYVELGKDYYIKSVTITTTPTGRNYTTGNYGIILRKDKTDVFALKWSYLFWEAGSTSSKTSAVDTEYTTTAVNQIYFGGRWGGTGAPAAGEATLTIDKIEITCWKNPLADVSIENNDITVTSIGNCSVNENVVTASTVWPKFLVTLPRAYYATSIDVAIENAYGYGLAWHNGEANELDLIFEDGTSVSTTVTGSGNWKAQIAKNSSGTVNIVIPEAYRSKKIVGIEMEGYFPATSATVANGGSITVTGVELNGVPDSLATIVADKINNPVTYDDGICEYELLNSFYQEIIDSCICHYDYSPDMISASIDENMQYGLVGTPIISAEIPFISSNIVTDDYYISEIGIVALPTETLGTNELTINTDGVITVYKSCYKGEDLTEYQNYSCPIVLGIDYANVQITVRAYVIYSNGKDQAVFYSDNTTDNNVSNGTATVTFPNAIEYTEIIGDANSDGNVNILDLIRLKKFLCNVDDEISFIGADCNADGSINATDLTKMRVYLLNDSGLPSEPYINEFLDSDIWKTTIDGRMFSKNMSDNNYNNAAYDDITYTGGTDVRTENYTRGMGLTSWHATEGYNLSEATKAIDKANLEELNVTSKRTWGEGVNGVMDSSYTYTTNLNVSSILEKQEFSDGTLSSTAFQFSDSNAVSKIINNWSSLLENPLIRNQNKLLLIGNEYRNYFENKTTGKYEYSGYDTVTLNGFRNSWCPSRFGNIEILNTLCNTDYSSFDDVYPSAANKLLFYEFWLYQRNSFETVMTDVVSGIKQIYPDTKWGYAAYGGPTDSLANNLYIDFLDYTSQNLYYVSSYMKDLHGYSFQADNLAAWSKTAPVMITEIGFENGFTNESKEEAARKYKQVLNLLYMRPRIIGSYIFNYTTSTLPDESNLDRTWGMVDPYRNKYPAYYSVKQVYSHFKLLDSIYNGASNTPLVAITNLATDDRILSKYDTSMSIASILYSKGIPVQVIPSDDSTRFDTLEETKLIFNDNIMYQNPDGSGCVGASIANYLNNGGKIFRTNNKVPTSLYGVESDFNADSTEELTRIFSGLTVIDKETDNKKDLWSELGKFIHEDFVTGNVEIKENTIDENAVRVLDVEAFSNSLSDKTYDIETKMVYKNGEMYLCLVNTGDTSIDSVDITIGVNNGVKCNLSPSLICGDEGTEVATQRRAYIPSWVDDSIENSIEYGTVTVKNLDTYAYIHLGRAVIM